jgi:hypothetical protein
MIHSSRAIALVLISSATILLGYHTFEKAADYDGADDWADAPTTQSSSSGYHGHSSYYYGHGYHGGTGGFFSSSGSRSSHGTSHGGFGGTGHSVGS